MFEVLINGRDHNTIEILYREPSVTPAYTLHASYNIRKMRNASALLRAESFAEAKAEILETEIKPEAVWLCEQLFISSFSMMGVYDVY